MWGQSTASPGQSLTCSLSHRQASLNVSRHQSFQSLSGTHCASETGLERDRKPLFILNLAEKMPSSVLKKCISKGLGQLGVFMLWFSNISSGSIMRVEKEILGSQGWVASSF